MSVPSTLGILSNLAFLSNLSAFWPDCHIDEIHHSFILTSLDLEKGISPNLSDSRTSRIELRGVLDIYSHMGLITGGSCLPRPLNGDR